MKRKGTSSSDSVRTLFAGGGTGGHLYPALALADRIQMNWRRAQIEFVGSHRGVEVKEVPRYGYRLHKLRVGGLVGKDLDVKIKNILRIPIAVWQSLRIISAFKPELVVGVGGYASAPTMIAAWISRTPRALMEQNSAPGLANRILSKIVQRCYVSFESSCVYFPKNKTRHVGNPVRVEILEDDGARPDPNRFTVLLFGGSKGSRKLNNVFIDAYAELKAKIPNLRLIHQTGQGEYFRAKERYEAEGIDEVEMHSFIEDMGHYYRIADLCVCRGGASSIAELAALRAPAILVPIKKSSGDHQRINALTLCETGGAAMIDEDDLTSEKLVEIVSELAQQPEKIEIMRKRLEALPHPDASKAILEDLPTWISDLKWKKEIV